MTPEMTFEISKTRIAELHRASERQRSVRTLSTDDRDTSLRGPRVWMFLRRLAGPAHA